MPDLRLEAPQEGDQQHGQQQGDQRVANDRCDLQARLGQAQLIELLQIELRDQVAGTHDHLVLADLDLNRLDLVPRGLLRLLGECGADPLVGGKECGGQIAS